MIQQFDFQTNQNRVHVTATAHVKIFDAKIRSNLTWHSNMLKMKYLPEKASQKIRNCRPRRTNARDDRKDVYSVCETRHCAHPWEIDTTIVTETSVPDACLNFPAVSCVVTSASAGSRGQFPLNDSNC